MKKLKLNPKVSYKCTEDENKKIKLKEIKPYLLYYKRHLGLISLCIFFMLLSTCLGIVFPIITGKLIATFTSNFVAQVALKYALFILTLEIIAAPINYIIDILWNKTQINVRYDMGLDVVDHINKIKIISFDNNNTSKFTTRMFTDVIKIAHFPLNILNYIMNIISKLGFVGYTFSLSIEIGLYMLGYIILSIVIEFTRYNMRLRHNKILRNYSENEENIQYENIHGMRDIRALNSTDNVISKIDEKYQFKASLGYKYSRRNSIFFHSNNLLKSFVYFFFLFLGIRLITTGQLEVAAFIIAYNYHSSVASFAQNIINIKSYSTEVLLSANRLNELYSEDKFPTEKFGNKTISDISGKLTFKNVNFKYNENAEVLQNINFEIEPNSIVSFVGKSGSGKSTIASLISKLYYLDDNSGEILLDDININELTRNTIRDNICLVSQFPYIFDMTIEENLKLAKPNATTEEIDEVLKIAELYDFVYSQPNKLETKLGENGIKLSGGQRQRLAISRALLKKSKIIVFDEATSSLDNENQEKIKNVMKKMSQDHTIVMIAHRLSTVVDSDKIIFVKDGKVHAEGTHKYLMKNCNEYKALYSKEEKDSEE